MNPAGDERDAAPWVVARPSLAAVLALVTGQFLPSGAFVEVPVLVVALLLAAAWFLVFRARPVWALGGWVAAWLAAGMLVQAAMDSRATRDLARFAEVQAAAARLAVVEGRLDARPKAGVSGGLTLWLAPGAQLSAGGHSMRTETPLAVRVPVAAAGKALRLGIGDPVRVVGVAFELPHARDAEEADRSLRVRGAVIRMRARAVESVGAAGEASSIRRRIEHSAIAVGDELKRAMDSALPAREAALMAAIALGDTDGLEPDQWRAFQATALIHLFSVSGFHTMLIGALTLGLLRRTGLSSALRLAAFVPALGGFVLLVGADAPVLRAAVLLLAACAGELLRRPVDALAALCTIASAMMVASPGVVHHLDFQLTFLGAAALALCSGWRPVLEAAVGRRLGWNWRGAVVVGFLEAVFIGTVVQLAMAPVLASWFGTVSVVAPLANGALGAVAVLTVWWAAVASVLHFVWAPLGWVAFATATPALWLLDVGADVFARVPGATAASGAWPAVAVLVWYALLLASPWTWQAPAPPRVALLRPIPAFLCLVLGLLNVLVWMPSLAAPRPVLGVTFLDVGQGDAILVRARDGASMLVDAGPDAEAARALARRGVESLVWFAATHSDSDHIGGYSALAGVVGVGEVLVPDERTAATLRERVGPVAPKRIVGRGDRLRFGTPPIEVEVLHPTPEFRSAGDEDDNEASLVLRVRADDGSFVVLLTGDAGEPAERSLLAAGVEVRADVLKAGHHGAATSTGVPFLAAVRPRFVLISAGATNRYGHPSPGVLERSKATGASILRTDRDGTVSFRVWEGGRIEVRTAR